MRDYKVILEEISEPTFTPEIAAKNITRKIEEKRILQRRIWEIFQYVVSDRPSDDDIYYLNDCWLIYPTKVTLGSDDVSESVVTSIYDKYSKYEYWSRVVVILFYYGGLGVDELSERIENGFGYDLENRWDDAAMWLNMFFDYYHETFEKKSVETCTDINRDCNNRKGCIKLTEENKEKLKMFFKGDFRNVSGNGYDYFSECLIKDFEQKYYTRKEWAAIALIIHESDKFTGNRKYRSFNKWRDDFFDIIGVKKCTYNANKLEREANNLKAVFYYLCK